MGIDEIRELIDSLYEQGQTAKAEEVLISTAGAAAEEGDDYLLLQILNELIGHYRETGEWDKAFEIADRSVMVAGYVFPKESVPYATTLLNVASMYRAAGKLAESRSVYHEVEQIYAVTLKADDMLFFTRKRVNLQRPRLFFSRLWISTGPTEGNMRRRSLLPISLQR